MTTAARIDELRKKFEENPRRYFAPLANELRKAGELSQAIALCREHLPKQPGHMSGYIVFGQALYESGELSEARGVFEQALALDPENLIALRHLGDIARRQGEPLLARRWYERVLEADPRNDDIAAQLATLATPAAPVPAVPAAPYPPVAAPTPAYAVPPIQLGALPTPDAAMRAVDIGAIPLRAPEPPPLLDLDAIEAFTDLGDSAPAPASVAPELPADDGAVVEESSHDDAFADAPVVDEVIAEATVVEEVAELPVVADALADGGQADPAPETAVVAASVAEDDPFAFAAAAVMTADAEPDEDASVDVEAAFEEGLAAPEWPDTSALAARIGTPRAVTPLSVPIPPEAAEAFGREPGDERSPVAHAAAPEPVGAAEPEPVVTEPVVEGPVDDELVEPTAVVTASDELDDLVTSTADDDELPWLAVPADDLSENDEVSAIADALEDDARASGDDGEVEVLDRSESAAVPAEASFADVMPEAEAGAERDDGAIADDATSGEPDGSAAFVTETMAELLVSQGLTAQAVSVYEELVRRRPYDPLLSARLAEVRDMAAPAAPVSAVAPETATPVFTARERFNRLAVRRAPRPATVSAASTPEASGDDSLSALFGSAPMPQDDVAARSLAAAFAPAPEVPVSASFFAPTPAAGAVRQATPLRPLTPIRSATPIASASIPGSGSYSFDRFFPDPAVAGGGASTPGAAPAAEQPAVTPPPSAGDDLAQFSAWLKGLGNT
jgi:tetratricopeptide (TPR) repeat protein